MATFRECKVEGGKEILVNLDTVTFIEQNNSQVIIQFVGGTQVTVTGIAKDVIADLFKGQRGVT